MDSRKQEAASSTTRGPWTEVDVVPVARQLAAIGEYDGALALLEVGASDKNREPAMLLRAKIAAQQGRLDKAIAIWTDVLSAHPGLTEAEAGIELAARLAKRGSSHFRLWATGYVTLVVAAVSLLLILTVLHSTADRDPEQLIAIRSMSERLDNQANRVKKMIDIISNEPFRAAVPSSNSQLNVFRRGFGVPGVLLDLQGNELLLKFELGLFRAGHPELRTGAATMLGAVANAVKPYGGQFKLRVMGQADSTPVPPSGSYRDNDELALARGVAVTDFLRRSGVPAHMLSVQLGDPAVAPFPNDTRENRSRNRTATIRIVATGE